jgi:hypothetical protein
LFAPNPLQRPGPPILLGGIARPALERAGRLADGWVTSSRTDLSRISEGISVVRAAAGEAGRDPDSIRIICRGVVRAGAPVTVPEGGGRVLLSGSYADIRGDVEWLAERGVTEIFYDLNWDPLVGAPDADPFGAVARAEEILTELAPGGQPEGDAAWRASGASWANRPSAPAGRCGDGRASPGWPRSVWPGCSTHARWPSWAR